MNLDKVCLDIARERSNSTNYPQIKDYRCASKTGLAV